MNFYAHFVCFVFAIVQTTTSSSFVREGRLNLDGYNFAFLASFCGNATGPVVQYNISYSQELCCPNLLSYFQSQWSRIWPHSDMECSEKTGVLETNGSQVLNLTTDNPQSGCRVVFSGNGSSNISCRGSQIYQLQAEDISTNKCWFIAVSNCNSSKGLQLEYSLNITGAEPNKASKSATGKLFAIILSCMVVTWLYNPGRL